MWDEHELGQDWYGPGARPGSRRWGWLLIALLSLLAFMIMQSGPEPTISPDGIQPTLILLATAPPALPIDIATPLPGATQPDNTPSTSTPIFTRPDEAALQKFMLDLINLDRAEAGLESVAWDELAADVGRRHTQDMVAFNYFSHWNRAGLGPDHRYTLAGGQHAVMENLYAFALTYSDGRGAPIDDWEAVIERAQTDLMNSRGHQSNILDPAHTHVGIGMAYDESSGRFRLAQEFTNQYVTLYTALPLEARAGEQIEVHGKVDSLAVTDIVLNLAYESFPASLSLEELAHTGAYTSAAESLESWSLDRIFDQSIILPARAGIYHIRIFAQMGGSQTLLLDHNIWVSLP